MTHDDLNLKLVRVSANLVEHYTKLNRFYIDVEQTILRTPNDQELGKQLRSILTDYKKFEAMKESPKH